MKAFETTFDNVVYRFVLMMAVVLVSFMGAVPMLAILAVPILLSALLGIKFEMPREKKQSAAIKSIASKNVAA